MDRSARIGAKKRLMNSRLWWGIVAANVMSFAFLLAAVEATAAPPPFLQSTTISPASPVDGTGGTNHHKEPVIIVDRYSSEDRRAVAWMQYGSPPKVYRKIWNSETGMWGDRKELVQPFGTGSGDPFFAVNPLNHEVVLVAVDFLGTGLDGIRLWPGQDLGADWCTSDCINSEDQKDPFDPEHKNHDGMRVCNAAGGDKPSVTFSPSGKLYVAHTHVNDIHVQRWDSPVWFGITVRIPDAQLLQSPIVLVTRPDPSAPETLWVIADDLGSNKIYAWFADVGTLDWSETRENETPPATSQGNLRVKSTGALLYTNPYVDGNTPANSIRADSMIMARYNGINGAIGIVWHQRKGTNESEARFVSFDTREKKFGCSIPVTNARGKMDCPTGNEPLPGLSTPDSEFHPAIEVDKFGHYLVTYYNASPGQPTELATEPTTRLKVARLSRDGGALWDDEKTVPGSESDPHGYIAIGEYQDISYSAERDTWYAPFIKAGSQTGDTNVTEMTFRRFFRLIEHGSGDSAGTCTALPAAVEITAGESIPLCAPEGTSWEWHLSSAEQPHHFFPGQRMEWVSPTVDTTYWVKVDDDEYSDPVHVTVRTDCPSLIEDQPENDSIDEGSSAHFSVTSSEPDATFTWYEGARGDTSKPVGSSSAFTTPRLSATTHYWCRVKSSSSECKADSVGVEARVCNPARFTQGSPTGEALLVAAGTDATVDAAAAGTQVTYEWWLVKRTRVNAQSPWGNSTVEPQPQATGSSFSWHAVANTQVEVHVRIRGACGDSQERFVRLLEGVANEATCPTPQIFTGFPAEISVNPALPTPPLSVIIEPYPAVAPWSPELDSNLIYRWYVNGEMFMAAPGVPYATPVFGATASQGPLLIRMEVRRTCGSPAVTRTAYVWNESRCPIPSFAVDQLTIGPDSPNRTFTALSDWPSLRFEWYPGDSGDTRGVPVRSKSFTPPNGPGTWWVRAISTCGTHADSPTLTVTTSSCAPVQILANPKSAVVKAREPHTLTVEPFSTRPPAQYEYRWLDDSGSNAAIGTSRDLTIEAGTLLHTTSYRVEVTSPGCHMAKSTIATLHVTACDDIDIARQPQSVPIGLGETATPSIDASSRFALSYQWYEGESGDTTRPVAGQTQPMLSVAPLATTKYWVRVSIPGDCEVDSQAITVWVCAPPSIAPQPVELTSYAPFAQHWLNALAYGERLTYQWYEGLVGDTSIPVGNQQSLTSVRPAETTSYWFRATSDCVGTLDAYKDSNQLRVSVCPHIASPPTAQYPEVMPGARATLSIEAERADAIDWYAGNPGEGTKIGSGSPFVTPAISGETKFSALVSSGTCSIASEPVTVGLCSQPTVYWGPGLKSQVASGEEQLLGVGGTVSGLYEHTLTWYSGDSGHPETSTRLTEPSMLQVQLSVHPTATTKYWVRMAEESGCYKDTPTFTVNVCVPTITGQPQSAFLDRVTNPSATAALTVEATGENLTYQWYIGDSGVTSSPINGETSKTLANLHPQEDTKYWVRVRGCAFPKDSATATVTVCKATAITREPVDITSTANATVMLSVAASGTGLTYQWYTGIRGDTSAPIAGATTATREVAPAQTTRYWVRVSGRCGSSIDSVTVKVSIPPTITTQPVGGDVTRGTMRTLTVVAAGNLLSYQWYSGSGTSAPITGATSASYPTPAINADATYWVRVFSGDASTDSEPAVLTVCQPRWIWVQTNSYVSGSPVTMRVDTVGMGESYTWYRGESGDVSAYVGSGYQITVNPTGTTKYWVRTTRPTCDADSSATTITICVPAISAQPQGGMINSGSTKALSVTATGTAPVTYQWYIGSSGVTSNPVSGATSSSYTTPPLSATTTYWVQVRGLNDASCSTISANSAAATVTVCQPPTINQQPPSPIVAANSSVQLAVSASGTNLTYQWYSGTSGNTASPIGSTSSALTVSPGVTSDYWVKVSGSCGSVNSTTAKVSIAPTITTQPAGDMVTKGSTRTLTVAASGTQLSYQWYTGTSTLISGATSPSYTTPPINADTIYWARVWSGNAPTDSAQAALNVCQPRTVSLQSNSRVSGSPVTMQVDATATGESYTWYRGETGDVSTYAGSGSQITVYPTGTARYWVRTARSTCDADSPAITVTICAPAISAQPQGAMINSGSTKTLSVTATGTTPVTYQWYIGSSGVTSNPVSGATAASYTTSALTSTTTYWVQVKSPNDASCSATSTNSSAATVTVCQAPAITSGPTASTQRIPGTTGSMTVTASGTGLTYQWFNGQSGDTTVPVPNCSTAQCSFTLSSSKYYWVRIIGTCGTLNSPAVIHPVSPSIYQQPQSASVPPNATPMLSVGASGTSLTYQWYRGATGNTTSLMSDATAPTFTVPAVTQPVSYWCRVTSVGNPTAITDSAEAALSFCTGPSIYGPLTQYLGYNQWRLGINVEEQDLGNVDCAWYIGVPGNVAQSVFQYEGGTSTNVTATSTQTWWCRAWYSDHSCYTDTGGTTIYKVQ